MSPPPGDTHRLSELRIVLLGSRNAGKNSSGKTILGSKEFGLQRDVTECVMETGDVAERKITVVKAPGWQRNKAVRNSPESLKQQIVLSVSMCPPGPHAVLLVLPLSNKSWKSEKNVLEGYLMLLTETVWSHTIILFTFGDSLGDGTIEQYIERVEYLQCLVKKCRNRYHVFNNTKRDECQVTELLEKIEVMVAENKGYHLEINTVMEHEGTMKKKGKTKEKKSKEESSAGELVLCWLGDGQSIDTT